MRQLTGVPTELINIYLVLASVGLKHLTPTVLMLCAAASKLGLNINHKFRKAKV